MNLIFSILFIPLLAGNFFSDPLRSSASDEIFWSSDRKLSWDDFKCAPTGGAFTGAATYATIKANPKVANFWNTKLEVEVRAVFRCDKSWAKEKAKESDYLLNHEQRHFDIAEIFARKLRNELQEHRITPQNYDEIKEQVIEKWFAAYDAYDRSYDKLTVHGLSTEAQEEWNREIDRQLEELPAGSLE